MQRYNEAALMMILFFISKKIKYVKRVSFKRLTLFVKPVKFNKVD